MTALLQLPGQSVDDSHPHIVRNVSVSARERCCRRGTSIIRHVTEHPRPFTTLDSVTSPRSGCNPNIWSIWQLTIFILVIRNVSTTVRAVRTLSKVMEAPNESRSVTYSDNQQFPSECTITINKVGTTYFRQAWTVTSSFVGHIYSERDVHVIKFDAHDNVIVRADLTVFS